MVSLSTLLNSFSRELKRVDHGRKDVEISSITADSRQVDKGSLFVAIRGVEQNGETYIEAARKAGAVAILTRNDVAPLKGIVHLTSENERKILAKLAAHFSPSPKLKTVAVTGTNGKTSTAEFFRQLLEIEGAKAASIGTMGLGTGSIKGLDLPALNTSPDPVLLHEALRKLQNKGAQAVALEASSHGLHQHRMDGVQLTAAAFTNLSRDHLDYHKTEKAYFEAKLRLFAYILPRGQTAVLNKDDRYFGQLKKMCELRKHRIVTYGTDDTADLILRKIERTPDGMELRLRLHDKAFETSLPLIGDFQAMNILAALGLAEACGHEMMSLTHGLRELHPVRGRMEQAAPGIYVDYAHTPDALEKALQTMRAHCKGKLGVVMGCGGDRDAGKRAPMGKIASELADFTIITDDNPRTEDAAAIRKAVMTGATGSHCKEVADRAKAIEAAVNEMGEGDMLLVAGKGHETYQIIGTERHAFDDVAVVKGLLK